MLYGPALHAAATVHCKSLSSLFSLSLYSPPLL